MTSLTHLIAEINACEICKAHLPFAPNPVFSVNEKAKILLIGHAPGRVVNETNIPWNDRSGDELRKWMGIDKTIFYNSELIAIMAMGFCYPGTGKNGDLPPRPECAPQWHNKLLQFLPNIELIILIGEHAQKYYLQKNRKINLTETVCAYNDYLPKYFPLVHPSPRNIRWHIKNPWFKELVVVELKNSVKKILAV